jgi:hypothetical protein
MPQANAKQCFSRICGEGVLSLQGCGWAWEIHCSLSGSWEMIICYVCCPSVYEARMHCCCIVCWWVWLTILANVMANNQYSCCSPLVVIRSEKLHLRRYLSSFMKFSAPIEKIHWAWVACKTCVISPVTHFLANRYRAQSLRWDSLIEISFEDIIPIMKFPHPILSYDAAMFWISVGNPAAQSSQVIWPLPSAYAVTTALMWGVLHLQPSMRQHWPHIVERL